jgi:outer membrane protein assembly factor BamB
VDGERVYALGAMGDLICLDAARGSVLWSRDYRRDFGTLMNMWGMAAAPLIEGDKLLVLAGGADGACVVALDKRTGAELWRALESEDPGYSAPIVIRWAGVRQLIVWTPLGLYALNPDNGQQYWFQAFETRMGHAIATPVFDESSGCLLVSSFFNGSLMMRLDRRDARAARLWKGASDSELPQSTDGLHSLMSTPVISDGHVYGVCSYGQLRCLDAATGRRIWETRAPTGDGRWWNAFLVRYQQRYFLCNEQGELILAELSPQGYSEISRTQLIEPTATAGRRKIVWSHPAFANRCIYARNDKHILCIDMSSHAAP